MSSYYILPMPFGFSITFSMSECFDLSSFSFTKSLLTLLLTFFKISFIYRNKSDKILNINIKRLKQTSSVVVFNSATFAAIGAITISSTLILDEFVVEILSKLSIRVASDDAIHVKCNCSTSNRPRN